jgi:hypothetical protein
MMLLFILILKMKQMFQMNRSGHFIAVHACYCMKFPSCTGNFTCKKHVHLYCGNTGI